MFIAADLGALSNRVPFWLPKGYLTCLIYLISVLGCLKVP